MSRLTRAFWIFAALVFLAEAWVWDHLGPWIKRAIATLPLKTVRGWIEARISALPPYATLVVFVLAGSILAPFKFVEVWLFAHHYYVATILLFLVVKTLGVGLTAFLFGVCKPKLMQIGWFVRLYDLVLRLRSWAEIQVRPTLAYLRALKARIRAAMPRGLILRRAKRIRHQMGRPKAGLKTAER